jgi:CcmD family protein
MESILKDLLLVIALAGLCLSVSCYDSNEKETNLMRFPISDRSEFKTLKDGVIDKSVTSDGNGSLYVDTQSPVSIELFTVDGSGLDHTRAAYKAMLKTEGLTAAGGSKGIAYLEMKVLYPGGKEIVSRGPRIPPSGTTGWTPAEAVIYADKGVKPDKVMLGLVVDGKGKVWIDDVMLVTQPLRLDYLFWGNTVVWLVLVIYIYQLFGKQRRLRRELEAMNEG